jgi:ACGX-repeat protein
MLHSYCNASNADLQDTKLPKSNRVIKKCVLEAARECAIIRHTEGHLLAEYLMEVMIMALSNLFSWKKKNAAPTACGAACGASEKPAEAPAACGAAAPQEKPAACGAACGASDKPVEAPAACGAAAPQEKPAACGAACGAGDKQ